MVNLVCLIFYKIIMKNIFLGIVFFTLSMYSQTTPIAIDLLTKQLQNSSNYKASESIYLQTSKDIYETREDLWFKAYVLESKYLTPSNKSKTLFVQLLQDNSNTPVWEEKYEIENGFVNGHLFLQDTLKPGDYTLAAYSSNSFYKNNEAFNAIKKIQVLKNIQAKQLPEKQIKQDSIAQFDTFPEGGNLVANIKNKLAFKAVNSKGNPIKISGVLYENNQPLIQFKSNHFGMGSLIFTPNQNKNYHIELSKSGKDKIYSIPKIHSQGKVIRLISQTKEYLFFKISQNNNIKKETVHVRVQGRGTAYSLASATLEKEITLKIPLKELPKGIVEITLFDGAYKPICERLVFVNSDQKLNITTRLNKSEYQTRAKGQLKIQVSDQHGNPVIAHLGLSIFDRIYKNKNDTKTIESHYHLSTQLKGKLYNPAYYFNDQNLDRNKALDLLLLTQGWRRYAWTEPNLTALKNSKQVLFDEINGLVKIKEKRRKKKRTKKDLIQQALPIISVFNPEYEDRNQIIILDSLGRFTVTQNYLKLGERNYAYFKLMVPQGSKHFYTINNNWFKSINALRKTKTTNYPTFNFQPIKHKNITPFKRYAHARELDEVVLKTKTGITRDKYLGKLDSIVRLETIDWIAQPCGTLNCPFHPYTPGNKIPVEGESYSRYISTTYTSGKAVEILETVIYKKEELTVEATPVLSPTDRDKCKEGIAKEIKSMQKNLASNYYKPRVVRSVQIGGFGVVNHDVFVVTDHNLVAEFKVEGIKTEDIDFIQFDYSQDMMVRIANGNLQFKPESKNLLVGLLPDDKVAIFTPDQYESLKQKEKGSSVEVELKKMDVTINSADHLQEIILSYL